MRRALFVLTFAALSLAQHSAAEEGRRLALVIANGSYQNVLTPLKHPISEANLIQKALHDAGFAVTRADDLLVADKRIVDFLNGIQKSDVVVVYYSGYAVQKDKENYLLPVDFDPNIRGLEKAYNLLGLQQSVQKKGPRLTVFILEAADRINVNVNGVVEPGLTSQPEPLPSNSLFAFANSPTETLPSRGDQIGRFTESIAKHMKEPGTRLLDVFKETQRDVTESPAGQIPFIQDNILGSELYFTYPAMVLNQESLTFNSTPEVAPPPQSLSVSADGYVASFRVSVPANDTWLSVTPVGKTPASRIPSPNLVVSVSPVNPIRLPPGTYNSEITITAPDSDLTSAPRTVTVTYAVRQNPSGPATNVPRQNPKDKQDYVWIPIGQFTIGCTETDQKCKPDEKPPRPVRISKGFWMGKNEVTVREYERYIRQQDNKKMPKAPLQNKNWSNADFPMVEVTWSDAASFCSWAGGRLPTESEWEYAARADTKTIYPWGNEIVKNNARYNHTLLGKENQGNDLWPDFAPVGQYEPNAWGLLDVVGNVWEWCSDWYQKLYDLGPVDPKGPPTGAERVLRGGAYNSSDAEVRLSTRGKGKPDDHNNTIGFRCAIDNWPN